MGKRQDDFEEKLLSLHDDVQKFKDVTSSSSPDTSSPSGKKRKRIVTRSLSVRSVHIHG